MAVNSFNAQNPPLTTKGDLFTFSTIPTRLGIGSNNQVLTADSTAATGMKWATVSSGGTYSTWTPVIKQPTSSITLTVNSGSYFANYTQVGKMTHVQFFVNITGTGNANNYIAGTLPVNANKSNFPGGTAQLYDASSGLVYPAIVMIYSANEFRLVGTTLNTASLYLGDQTSAFTAALANNDQIYASFTYESV